MHFTKRTAAGAALLAATAASVLGYSGTAALADPSQGKNLTLGTADCGSDGMFTFIVSGNSGQGTAWNPAFVSTSTGQRALFHPASFDLTFTSPQGDFTQEVSKNSGPGPVTCVISATPFPGASLSGTVTGTLTWRG
jgi:hypothetical protein